MRAIGHRGPGERRRNQEELADLVSRVDNVQHPTCVEDYEWHISSDVKGGWTSRCRDHVDVRTRLHRRDEQPAPEASEQRFFH